MYESGDLKQRKEALNQDSLLINLSDPLRVTSLTNECLKDQSLRVLETQCNCLTNALQVLVFERENVLNKRQLLSVITRIFDYFSLLVFTTKMLKLLLRFTEQQMR